VNPGLTAPAGRQTWAPQTGFLVRFGTDVEDFTLDILISVVLGIFLAVISDRRLGRHTES
jgi:low temperature requirement protein LtrA